MMNFASQGERLITFGGMGDSMYECLLRTKTLFCKNAFLQKRLRLNHLFYCFSLF